jgi:regulator of protease activity HflC (stomatin/prohibitin superfamily)
VVVLSAVLFVVVSLDLGGLTPVAPGRARVIQLFGSYRGTIHDLGLQWANPFTKRITVSVRIRNEETAQAKVNHADGNPIEIAAVIVWQVRDTAAATYAVDDYTAFVAIQAETAVRHIASAYPHDSTTKPHAVTPHTPSGSVRLRCGAWRRHTMFGPTGLDMLI